MWTLFLIASALSGIAALAVLLFTTATGWDRLSLLLGFLVTWLPATSVLSLIVLIATGVKAGWRWTLMLGIVLVIGALQWSLLMMYGNNRVSYCLVPCVLIFLCILAFSAKHY